MFFCLTVFAEAYPHPVISRKVSHCGSPNFWGKEQCAETERTLVNYTGPDGERGRGVVINCERAGTSSCPKHIAPNDLSDENDVTWANFLMDYYDDQIVQGNYSGTHSITVLLPNGDYIYYSLTWTYAENNGEVSGYVQIDRL